MEPLTLPLMCVTSPYIHNTLSDRRFTEETFRLGNAL